LGTVSTAVWQIRFMLSLMHLHSCGTGRDQAIQSNYNWA
jgi:hypothetical protein